jgi:cell division protein FtsL
MEENMNREASQKEQPTQQVQSSGFKLAISTKVLLMVLLLTILVSATVIFLSTGDNLSNTIAIHDEIETEYKDNIDTVKISEDTLEYTYYDKNIPFTFRYQKGFCWTQDIGAVAVHNKLQFCGGNNTINIINENILLIIAFPEEKVNTTEEYLELDRLKSFEVTGKSRDIGGYKAIELRDILNPGVLIYAFLTDYVFDYSNSELFKSEQFQHLKLPDIEPSRYGFVIRSGLSKEEGGKEAEELILSTLKFN